MLKVDTKTLGNVSESPVGRKPRFSGEVSQFRNMEFSRALDIGLLSGFFLKRR